MVSAMMPVALFSLLIGVVDRRMKYPIINLEPIIFLFLLPTGKVADNQKAISQV